jgi:uncharacterized phage protein gp47/JayE
MAFGVTSSGFVLKRLEDIKEEIVNDVKTTFGNQIDTSSDGPLGQLIDIFAAGRATDWLNMQAIYNAFYPSTASGVNLDRIASINGITRRPATPSTGELTFEGTNGVTVPAGTVAQDSAGRQVETTTSGEITGGTLTVTCVAAESGDVTLAADTVTELVTSIFGVDTVNNAAEITGGQDRETDEELRIRRRDSLQNPGTSTKEGIRNALTALDFVINAIVIENTADTTVDGRPGHSFEAYILTNLTGGITGFPTERAAVSSAIWNAKPAGIETHGDLTDSVTDSEGFTHDVNYSEATEVALDIAITVTENTDSNEGDVFPSDGEDLVKAAIKDYIDGLTIGQDVWLNRVESAATAVAGVKGVASTTIDAVASNKTISVTELATVALVDVTVTVV